jgi:hypothetical protein
MKIIATLFISCSLYFPASSQSFKFIGDYSLGLPQQQMGQNIQAVHSLHAGGLYQLPGQFKNLSVGLELGAGVYAHKEIEQTFNFDANTSTVVPVIYNSNVFNANLQTRYQFLDEKRYMIVPYINAKAGLYNFFSNVTIEDPADPGGCRALDKKSLINDKTFYWGAGAGVQINPSIFSKHKKGGPVMFDISINTIRGGKLDYINTKHLKHEEDVPQMGGKPLMVKFINVGTQDIHEHMVAQVYTSALRIIELRAGLIVDLGKL